MQYLVNSSIVFTSVDLDGLFSWKRSPPSSTQSAAFSCAYASTSSNASNGSAWRMMSLSRNPRWLSVATTIRKVFKSLAAPPEEEGTDEAGACAGAACERERLGAIDEDEQDSARVE